MTHHPFHEQNGHLVVSLNESLFALDADRVQESVLRHLRDRDLDGLVMDASGVLVLPTSLCELVARMCCSARLMGARPVLCGLAPDLWSALRATGMDLSETRTARSLDDAWAYLSHSEAADAQQRPTRPVQSSDLAEAAGAATRLAFRSNP